MSLPSLSLKRPVLAVVMSIMIVLFGVIGYTFLGVRDYPAIDPPIISVSTNYTGANADVIESQVTEPLEKAINGVAGIRSISSTSAEGVSNISVEFNLGADLETAANDVRDKVGQAARQLPPDIDAPPVVTKADANASAILAMTVQSNTRNILQVDDYAENVLVEKLQTIPGVSSIQVWGQKLYAMRLWLDPTKMAAYGLTPQDIQSALSRENVELPSGQITGNETALTVRTMGRLATPDEFNNMIIKNLGGRVIHFSDIGNAELGAENQYTILKEKGNPMIGLALVPQPGANYVAISDEFYKRLAQIRKDTPKDIRLGIVFDNSTYIRQSIKEVGETLAIALGLVVLIIYLFFRDWLIALRPLLDIPVSLIGAFFIMYLFGFTVNILTLLGIVLATGLVVDDGIVVTENIFKKLEAGMPRMKAAREGSEEVFFAVMATSITLAFVFLPIIFMQGFVGRLFREFGIVIAGAVLISSFVSLTLTPVLNLKLSRRHPGRSRFYQVTEPFFNWLEVGYKSSLKQFMGHRWIAVVIILVCLGISVLVGTHLKSELAPMEDRSQFRISLTAPVGTSFDAMDRYTDQVVKFVMDSMPEHKAVLSVTAPAFTAAGATNTAFMYVTFTDPDKRKRSQHELAMYLNRNLRDFPEGRGYVIEPQTIQVGNKSGLPIQFVIENINLDTLEAYLPKFLDLAYPDSVFGGVVDVDMKLNNPEIHLAINRPKATEAGISVSDISNTVQLALSNERFGHFVMNGKQYDVVGEVYRQFRDKPSDLSDLYVGSSTNPAQQPIQLDNLVSEQETASPPQIYHYNRYKSATISASLAPGKTVGEGIAEMQKIARQTLGPSFSTELTGTSRDYAESSSSAIFALVLALILIYLVLAAQFESFIDPFTIMLTVPLAAAGALLSLWLFDQTLNIFSEIGMIML
ncbi:MAG TPA: efflux RND transporter permease subunit, partial [Chitinophagaceae bacterium]|nr:efflux RND transporter permease subunit [Chitinophagaceae bacterium]